MSEKKAAPKKHLKRPFVYRAWPFETLKLVESVRDESKAEDICAEFSRFLRLVGSHGLKKSEDGWVSLDEVVSFCKDAGIATITEQQFNGLGPDKSTRLVSFAKWEGRIAKPLLHKKKPTPKSYHASLLEGVRALVNAAADTSYKSALARAKDDVWSTYVADFYKCCESGDDSKTAFTSVLKAVKTHRLLVNYRNEMRGKATPLMVAAKANQFKVCEALIEKKADINAEDAFQWTALNWAVSNSNTSAEAFIRKHGGALGSGDMDSDDDSD